MHIKYTTKASAPKGYDVRYYATTTISTVQLQCSAVQKEASQQIAVRSVDL